MIPIRLILCVYVGVSRGEVSRKNKYPRTPIGWTVCPRPAPGGFIVGGEGGSTASVGHLQMSLGWASIRPFHKETPQPLRAACSVLCYPRSKEVFPHTQMELPEFQFLPVAPYPVTTEKSLAPSV